VHSKGHLARTRPAYFPLLEDAAYRTWDDPAGQRAFVAVEGPSGIGKADTLRAWAATHADRHTVLVEDAGKLTAGYFGGLYQLCIHALRDAEQRAPDVVQRHEHSLKRLFPFVACSGYATPPDLTNSASQDERTRFYHHEYQRKLLNGIYEFLLDYCQTSGRTFLLVLDNAEQLSRTLLTFLRIVAHRRTLSRFVRIVLLFDEQTNLALADACEHVRFSPLTLDEAAELARLHDVRLKRSDLEAFWELSQGLPAKLAALLECHSAGPVLANYLSFDSILDFYLLSRGATFRRELLSRHVSEHCVSDDPIVVRNYETSDATARAALHRAAIAHLQGKPDGEQYMRLIHYTSLGSAAEELQALTPVSIKLQEIGLYDTWLDVFAKYYTNDQLRTLGDGNEDSNAVFLRVAFILYSLGLSQLALPYLELFYQEFPESLLTPTTLYAQSMTYGRYQVPVDLPRAEAYALLNLEKIDTIFKDHPRHTYIRVFAENALAYIRAKQGRLAEALELCSQGMTRMGEIYGDQRYALHQSILVYNTGQIHEIVGDFEGARATYAHAIRLDPYYGEYYNDMANLLQRYGHVDDALHFYARAIELCPPYYEAHLNRAGLLLAGGAYDGARADYERVLELKPDEPRAYLGLGAVHLEQEHWEEARQALQIALEHDPNNAQAYANRGLALLKLGQMAEARADLDAALARDARLSEAFGNRAVWYFESGSYSECLSDLDAALDLRKDADFAFNRGVALQRLGRPEDARAAFEDAVALGADSEEVRLQLASVDGGHSASDTEARL
jgi:tetratricopeptide (TPR) repeat protein